MGQVKSSTQLIVTAATTRSSMESSQQKPTILKHLNSVEVKQSELVQLDLYAFGNPQPEVSVSFL